MTLDKLLSNLGELEKEYDLPTPSWDPVEIEPGIVQTVQVMFQQQWDNERQEVVQAPHGAISLGLAYADLPYLFTVSLYQPIGMLLGDFTSVVSLYGSTDIVGDTILDYQNRGELPEKDGNPLKPKIWNLYQYHVKPEIVAWRFLVELLRERVVFLLDETKGNVSGTGAIRPEALLPPDLV